MTLLIASSTKNEMCVLGMEHPDLLKGRDDYVVRTVYKRKTVREEERMK